MSDGTGGEENPYSFRKFRSKPARSQDEDGTDSDETTTQPDLGLGNQPQFNRRSGGDSQAAGSSEAPRREENPFSFKHFLSREAGNGQSTGAKPKVFTSPTVSHPVDLDYGRSNSSRNLASNPEIASALPDFVQDHLVVEQCYLRDNAPSGIGVDLDNLPDFALNQGSVNDNGGRPRQSNFNNFNRRRDRNRNSRADRIPLDLPNIPNPPTEELPGQHAGGLLFDLPLVRDASISSGSGTNGVPASPAQPSASKSLPDFLSDGPIRSSHLPPADVTTATNNISPNQAPEERFQTENERLRSELDLLRGQNSEMTRRVQSLQSELRTLRAKEHEDTLTMEKALEQVEHNLTRATKRAVNAENLVLKLRNEVKSLNSEVSLLRQENWELRGGEGASGACGGPSSGSGGAAAAGKSCGNTSPDQQVQMQRVAQELKAAASTAESSLRQLLSGVDNLRLIASSMETMHRIEDRTKDYLLDSEDDGAGPAL